MDNLAHSLVGLAAAKAGLEKLSPGATAVCILSATVPDIDFIAAFSGERWSVLHYHRGLTHSIVGTIMLGLIVPSIFYSIGLLISKIRGHASSMKFRGLVAASLITAATHPILDWTNSYGVRPLLPWSGRWFYGDFVFVVDPMIWIILGLGTFWLASRSKALLVFWILLALVLSSLTVYSITSGRGVDHPVVVAVMWTLCLLVFAWGRKANLGKRFGSRLAIASLLLLLAYWGSLSLLHVRAMSRANDEMARLVSENGEQVILLAATPVVVNPFRWRCLAETNRGVYRFDVLLGDPGVTKLVRFEKLGPADAEILAEARENQKVQAFF